MASKKIATESTESIAIRDTDDLPEIKGANGTLYMAFGEALEQFGPSQIEAQGVTRDIFDLPVASVIALAQKGFRHVLGNEAASKVTTWKAKLLKDSGHVPSDDEIEASAQAFEDALLAHIDAGTMGRQAASGVTRASKLAPFDRHMRTLATADVRDMLAKMNVKVVKGVAQFADSTRDLADMVAKRIAADSDTSHRLYNTLAPRAKVLADADAAASAMAPAPEEAGLDF